MISINKVFLAGNLTRDPEIKTTSGGISVAELGIAINQRYTTRSGERREETCFVDVAVWNRQAEYCCEYLKKGAPVLVEGRLQYETWEKDGQKRSRIRVRADRVDFLPRNKADRDDGDQGNGGSSADDGVQADA